MATRERLTSTDHAAASAAPHVPLLPYQRADFESEARFRWNCWARQTGKSYTKSLRRIIRGLRRRRDQVFLSAGERQCRELMEKARMHCQALKIACDAVETGAFPEWGGTRLELRLPRGVRIIGLPANPQTARGFTGDVLLDEFAMHADDREIWAAMFPTLLRGDGELDIASTPHGKGNLFYQLQHNERFECHTVTLPAAIEQGLAADADEMRRAMGDDLLYRQEFLCEFVDEATAFLTFEQIDACADREMAICADVEGLREIPGKLYVGVDVGRVRDLTVVWVVRRLEIADWTLAISESRTRGSSGRTEDNRLETGCTLHRLETGATHLSGATPHRSETNGTAQGDAMSPALTTVAVFELAGAPFREQFELLSELMGLRAVRRCCIDSTGLGMQLAEELVEQFGERRIQPVQFTAATKSRLACGLKSAVEARRIRIPVNEAIRRDWHCVERTVGAGGQLRLLAPRHEGSHADRFWAAALAVHAAEENEGKPEAVSGRPLRFATVGAW